MIKFLTLTQDFYSEVKSLPNDLFKGGLLYFVGFLYATEKNLIIGENAFKKIVRGGLNF